MRFFTREFAWNLGRFGHRFLLEKLELPKNDSASKILLIKFTQPTSYSYSIKNAFGTSRNMTHRPLCG